MVEENHQVEDFEVAVEQAKVAPTLLNVLAVSVVHLHKVPVVVNAVAAKRFQCKTTAKKLLLAHLHYLIKAIHSI